MGILQEDITLDFLVGVGYVSFCLTLCGDFMSNYDLETYICMIDILNPTATQSEVTISLRPHVLPEGYFKKFKICLSYSDDQLYYLKRR